MRPPKSASLLGLLLCLLAEPAWAVDVVARVNAPYPTGAEVEFAANAVGSGEITFTWDFGDGTESEASTEGTASHVYDEPGHYSVIVVARDDSGLRSYSFLQAVHRPLPARPPTASSTIVFDRSRNRVCNVNSDNDTLSCISAETFELQFEVPVGDHPRTLAVSQDGTIWVVGQDDASVSVLDADGALLHTVQLPYASKPFGIAMNFERGVAYVTLQGTGQLAELDLSNGEILRLVEAGPWATGVSVDPSGERIFVTRFISPLDHGEVVELSATDLSVQRTFELVTDPGPDTEASSRGVPNYLRQVSVSPDGAFAWVPSKKDNTVRGEAIDGQALTFETSVRTIVSYIDLAANEEALTKRFDFNNRALGLSVAFSRIGDYAFVGLLGNNAVEVLDAYDSRIVAGTFELGKAPDGLVLDDAGHLFVNSFLSRSVVVLDAVGILTSTNFALDVITEVVVSQQEKLAPEVLLGKKVFYDAEDPRMGQDGYISCASCHLDGFEDGRIWDFTDRGEGLRNTTSLLGKRGTGQGRLHWSANFDEVQDFEHDIRGPFGGDGFLSDEVFNEGTRNTSLGDSKAGLSPELDALAAYVTSLDTVHPSPFRTKEGTLTESGWRGLELFERLGCQTCHGGSDYTDSIEGVVHDVGTITALSGKRLGEPLEGLDTPTLRGLWETAPYLHDGSASTLYEVLVDKNLGELHGATLTLSQTDLDDLVNYMLQIDNTARLDEVGRPEAAEPEPEEEPDELQSLGEGERGGCGYASVRGGPARQRPLALTVGILILLMSFRRQRRYGASVPLRRSETSTTVGVVRRGCTKSLAASVFFTLSLLGSTGTVSAASLNRVDAWGASGVPNTVSMYEYVPDKLADSAPVVVLIHFCGGSAAAVFGQARGGGLVAAADEYGFILVVPQAANPDGSGRCWDVGSNAALTRNGGGDTEAIAQMVEHSLVVHSANRERVYVTGDSSGGMTTQAMLALYPEMFKAGSALAGVPAGCWAVGNPGGGWSGACAGGTVSRTAMEWGDTARAMSPEYTGRRPRVQLLHGDADDLIRYQNHLEATKQWSNVLGLSENPTSTETVQLGNHQGSRQSWRDDCDFMVLDTLTSLGGDHGPSDALFLAEYIIPFFGLDDAGLVDPHEAACEASNGTGGVSGTGGGSNSEGSGGLTGAGGFDSSHSGGQVGGPTGGAPNPSDGLPRSGGAPSVLPDRSAPVATAGCSIGSGARANSFLVLVLGSLVFSCMRRRLSRE